MCSLAPTSAARHSTASARRATDTKRRRRCHKMPPSPRFRLVVSCVQSQRISRETELGDDPMMAPSHNLTALRGRNTRTFLRCRGGLRQCHRRSLGLCDYPLLARRHLHGRNVEAQPRHSSVVAVVSSGDGGRAVRSDNDTYPTPCPRCPCGHLAYAYAFTALASQRASRRHPFAGW